MHRREFVSNENALVGRISGSERLQAPQREPTRCDPQCDKQDGNGNCQSKLSEQDCECKLVRTCDNLPQVPRVSITA